MSGLTVRYLLVALLLLVLWACSLGPTAGSVGDRAGAAARAMRLSDAGSKTTAASWTNTRLPVRPTLTEIADSYIDDMTLDEELGQLFIGAFDLTTITMPITPRWSSSRVRRRHTALHGEHDQKSRRRASSLPPPRLMPRFPCW